MTKCSVYKGRVEQEEVYIVSNIKSRKVVNRQRDIFRVKLFENLKFPLFSL
jgi:hypothetical protein